jgi:hypothetical protein
MLIGKEKQIALNCIQQLEERLANYEKYGYPKSIGMQGLFEMNTKDTINFKIQNIKQIIHGPGKNSIGDIEMYCKSHFTPNSIEDQIEAAQKFHKKHNIKPIGRK